ncbi:glycerophosphodiester phosphodiesterase [Nocardioides perillae]|uniref:Glycerophosphoryl diester phosphodiesterase n=1 Tax=Nocardioides perillae TaxID=1119534 RepID=A0A7Y9ULE9_9ACTN|nr:glycerophosphodiester phosphodiesterase family protein [Nocardioides perillae]NYG54281.1 glycerophosphoryl diester phosphodiesterase [Nocardioides perillae]
MTTLLTSPTARRSRTLGRAARRLAVTLGTTAALTAAAATFALAAPGDDVTVVAHRGASAYAPENTLAAVREGVRLRADLVEVDVQRSKDGVLVLVHDTTLSRTTDVEEVFPGRAPWRVGDFTYAEMQRLDAGSWKAPSFAGERIPTLREAVFELRRSRAGLLLEVKSPALYPGIEAEIVADMRAVPGYVDSAVRADRLVVQSFDWPSMRTYEALEPTVPVGLLGRPDPALLPELATWADQVNPSHRSVDTAYVQAVHDVGMTSSVYTVNEVADMERAIGLGVDGIITDRPDVLLRVLDGRARKAA